MLFFCVCSLPTLHEEITTKDKELIQKNILYLTSRKAMETEELWFNSKQNFIKSHIPSGYNGKWVCRIRVCAARLLVLGPFEELKSRKKMR